MEILEEFAGEIVHMEDLCDREHPYRYDQFLHRPVDVLLGMDGGMTTCLILFDDRCVQDNIEEWSFADPYCLIRSEAKKIIVEKRADLGEDALLNRWDYENHVRKMLAVRDAEAVLEMLFGRRKE